MPAGNARIAGPPTRFALSRGCERARPRPRQSRTGGVVRGHRYVTGSDDIVCVGMAGKGLVALGIPK